MKYTLIKITTLLAGLSLAPLQAEVTALKTPTKIDKETSERLSDTDARSLLKQVALQSILPVYRELNGNARKLVDETRRFCGEPNEKGLLKVRQAWSEALSSWQQSSPLLFGPATEDSIDFTVYFRPVKKMVINGMLAKMKADPELFIDQATVAQSGVGGQGLATVEYLLFDRKLSDAKILGLFTDDVIGAQRCEYLMAVETLLASNLNTILHAWQTEGGNYAAAFYTGGEGSAYFTEAYQPIELLINRLYQAVQAIEIKKLGVPLALTSGGKQRTYPYKLEAWRSGHSLRNVMSVLKGVERLLLDGGVLKTLEAKENKTLSVELKQQLARLQGSQFASEDLFQLLNDSPTEVIKFHMQVKVLSGTVANRLAPALGVQLGFNQNDGD